MIDEKIENHSSVEKMLTKFKKKVRESKIMIEQIDRKHHTKKGDKKRAKRKKQNRIKRQEEIKGSI